MPRIALSLPDWRAVARELTASHTAVAPPGLLERVQELLDQAPADWSDQVYALEVDAGSVNAIEAAFASLSGQQAGSDQREASLAEAEQIIRDHQRRP
ncbi:MAG: hypothetical protein U0031_00660 [Thermomicrobiales bacterium]